MSIATSLKIQKLIKNELQNGPQEVSAKRGKFILGASWPSTWYKLHFCWRQWAQAGSKMGQWAPRKGAGDPSWTVPNALETKMVLQKSTKKLAGVSSSSSNDFVGFLQAVDTTLPDAQKKLAGISCSSEYDFVLSAGTGENTLQMAIKKSTKKNAVRTDR